MNSVLQRPRGPQQCDPQNDVRNDLRNDLRNEPSKPAARSESEPSDVALRRSAVSLPKQVRDDVVWRLAARLGDSLEALGVFAVNAHQDAQRCGRIALVTLDVLGADRCEDRVEVARLRIVGFPGVAGHSYPSRRLRSAPVELQPVTMTMSSGQAFVRSRASGSVRRLSFRS